MLPQPRHQGRLCRQPPTLAPRPRPAERTTIRYWILQALGNLGQMEFAVASIKLCWGPMLALGKVRYDYAPLVRARAGAVASSENKRHTDGLWRRSNAADSCVVSHQTCR